MKNRLAVVVIAYNEERLIKKVIDSMPKFVNYIIIVNDNSTDNTLKVIKKIIKKNLFIINNKKRYGAGKATILGYKKALELKADIIVTMNGDAQMDPKDMLNLIKPIIKKETDYAKGNRLDYKNVKKIMPKYRYYGNLILSCLTKFSSGYWKLRDSQCGYTAINKKALKTLIKNKIYNGYGFLNDILITLNVYNFKIKDVAVKPVYGKEKSKIKLYIYIPTLLILLTKKGLWRLYKKYL